MVERIREIIDYSGLTMSQFADGVEVPRAILSHIMSGRNKPSLDVVQKIITNYKTVDVNWLLLGEGEMLTKIVEPVTEKQSAQPTKISKETIVETTSVEVAEVEKVQSVNSSKPMQSALPEPEKQLKQIVFFYTDNTFSVYKPEV